MLLALTMVYKPNADMIVKKTEPLSWFYSQADFSLFACFLLVGNFTSYFKVLSDKIKETKSS